MDIWDFLRQMFYVAEVILGLVVTALIVATVTSALFNRRGP